LVGGFQNDDRDPDQASEELHLKPRHSLAFLSKHRNSAGARRDGRGRGRRRRTLGASGPPAIVDWRVELLEDRQLLSGNPVITAPATATVVEDGSVTFSAANGNAISAAYGATGTATVSFSIGAFDGTLTYKSTTGLTFINGTKNGGSGVNVSGTQAAIDAALAAGVVYRPNSGFTGSDTLQLLAENSQTGAVGTATISVTVGTVGAPIISAPATATVVEDSSLTFSTANGNAISANYGATGAATETFSIGASDGTITFKSTTGLTFINGTRNGIGAVTVSGTSAAINAALGAGVVYQPYSEFAGSDTIQLLADNGQTKEVGTATISLTVTAAPPVISAPATVTVVEDSSLTFSTAKGDAISVAYGATGAATESFSIGASDGTITLKSTTGLTFGNGTQNGGTGVNVSGTSAAINAALGAGVVYKPNNGFTGSDTLHLLAENGQTGGVGTAPIVVTVTTAPPEITVPPASTVLENNSLYFQTDLNNAIVVKDDGEIGNNADSMTLTVSNGTLSTLNTANLVVTGNGTSSMTFSGTPANFNVALDDLSYTPNGGFIGSDSLKVSVTDPVDNLSASKSVTIYITHWTTMTPASATSEQALNSTGAYMELLLSNGDLMVQGGAQPGPNGTFVDNGASATWYEITPVNGSYANGTWTQLASMNQARLYFSSDVLPNGDVFVFGGEFATDGAVWIDSSGNYVAPGTPNATQQYSPSAEIYDPTTNIWYPVRSEPALYQITNYAGKTQNVAMGGDQPSEVLPDGDVLVGNLFNAGTEIYIPQFNANGTPGQGNWEAGPSKQYTEGGEQSNEESWVKLGNGDILTYDIYASQVDPQADAELYEPTSNGGIGNWVTASSGNLPILTYAANGNELGPGMLLPNGNAFFAGPTGVTAFYDPSTGKWSQGPTLPEALIFNQQGLLQQVQLGMDDAPAAVMPNGDLLLALSPADTEPNYPQEIAPGPTFIFEFNPKTDVFTDVTPPAGNFNAANSFVDSMLVLPNGQTLLTNSGTSLQFYNLPSGDGPETSWRPTITSFTQSANGSYTLTGTQINGLDEGAGYGDDEQMAENYPIVRLKNTSTSVTYYATTSDWSSNGVATGSTPETVNVVLPTLPAGTYQLVVIANGINSEPITFVVPMAIHRITSNSSAAVATESSAGQLAPATAPAAFESGDNSSPGPVGLVSSVVNVAPTSAFGLASDFSLDDSPPTIRPAPSSSKTSTPVLSPPLQFDAALDSAQGVQWAGLIAALEILSA
jgi:hypothetical protein